MTDLDNFDTDLVDYAAWHFPCYRKINCPKRHIVEVQEGSIVVPASTPSPDQVADTAHHLSAFDLKSAEDGIIFVFLFLIIVITFLGCVTVGGTLCINRFRARPFNQFLISILGTDLLMALLVVPLHLVELLVMTQTSSNQMSCKIQVFFHLLVVSVRSWSISAFIVLHHLHNGIIPTSHSALVLVWTWIMSALLVTPTIVVPDSFVDFEECALQSQNYGMTIYVAVTVFFLPSVILTPVFMKWANLKKQFTLRRDISSDFLDIKEQTAEEEDQEDEEERVRFEQASLSSKDSSKSMSMLSLEMDRKPSQATMRFLKTDSNLPRTLFTFGIANAISWLPFFSLILATTVMTSLPSRVIFLFVVWMGFAQSPLTPGLTYLLSDRVFFLFNGNMKKAANSSLSRRVRTLTITSM